MLKEIKLKTQNQTQNLVHFLDEDNIEKCIYSDLKLIEKLATNCNDSIKISTSSALLLICLPVLKKIKNLAEIKLIIKKGNEPTELLSIAKVLRANKLPVVLKYETN